MNTLRSALAAVSLLLAPTAAADGPGEPAVGFHLPDYRSGEIISLEDFAGSVVYLDFWASWCGPCRKSFPYYDELYKQLGGEDFTLIAVGLDENSSDALRFLDRHPVDFPVVLDPSGETAMQWRVTGMPSSYLIGPDQTVLRSWVGFRSTHEQEIEHAIRSLLSR